jgi:hypothetical protein
LKILLKSVLILRILYPNEDFVVYTDACKEGIDGVLSQNGHVVCYESRKLKEHERHYATHDLELAVIVHALKMWRHYLMGKIFELRTNHIGLKYLFGQPSLMPEKEDSWNLLVSMNLISSISKEKRTRWLMHSVGGCMRCMLQPLSCTNEI